MKNQMHALLLGASLSLALTGASYAKSTLISLSTEALWPATSTPDGTLVYNVTTVVRAGAGLLSVTLSAGDMPPGVTVTFSPSVMRFTGNALESQTATMTVFSPFPVPLDCYPFTLTGTSQREVVTVTNVPLSLALVATRPPTLYLDSLTNSGLRLRGLGATTNSYQIQATTNLANPAWTSVGSSTADANGRFTFLTSQTSNSPVRFYRAVTP